MGCALGRPPVVKVAEYQVFDMFYRSDQLTSPGPGFLLHLGGDYSQAEGLGEALGSRWRLWGRGHRCQQRRNEGAPALPSSGKGLRSCSAAPGGSIRLWQLFCVQLITS